MPKFLVNRSGDAVGQTVHVHIRANAGKIKREKRDGRETIIVPSYAAKADTILNGILYPRDELKASYVGLNRTPAPLGHPVIGNKFAPALDPEALARNHIFAWNENARWDGDRIALDVVIDEARAKESEGGRSVLNAIDKGEPISTSTGLLCNLEQVDAADYKGIARNIEWDHVAILLNEDPAISTDEGVGIFVNSAGKAGEIEVINSALDDADRDLDWALDSAFRALEKRTRAPLLERMKAALIEAFAGSERATSANQEKAEMADDKHLDGLSAKVDTLSEAVTKITETVNTVATSVKGLADAQAEMKANQEAKDKAELDGLVEKIVKANILEEDAAKELTLNAARKLAEKAKPGKAAALNGAGNGSGSDDEWAGYDLNAGMDGGKGKEAH